MQCIKGTQYTFATAFGLSRTGKTVTVAILDSAGNAVITGFAAGSVVELGDGMYGVAISFSTVFNGFIKWTDTDDGITLYEEFTVIPDFTADITAIKKIEKNRWKISANQLVIYDDNGTTPLYVFNLLKEGVGDGSSPDERVPV